MSFLPEVFFTVMLKAVSWSGKITAGLKDNAVISKFFPNEVIIAIESPHLKRKAAVCGSADLVVAEFNIVCAE